MKIYAIIEKDEDNSIPVIDSNIFMTEDAADVAYQAKIKELCDMDPDCPIDESEFDHSWNRFINIEMYSTGAIKILDVCCDLDNLITLYLISITINND